MFDFLTAAGEGIDVVSVSVIVSADFFTNFALRRRFRAAANLGARAEGSSLAVGVEIENEIPENPYRHYFGPDYKLHLPVSNMENNNPREEIEKLTKKIIDNLKNVDAVNVDHSNYKN